jgi:hypothetical protein
MNLNILWFLERQLCSVGNIVASMGASIYPSHSACTAQSREAGANACILCQRRGQDVYSLGLLTLLHLSLFLFAGLVVFLFNVDQEVFTGVVQWIGLL